MKVLKYTVYGVVLIAIAESAVEGVNAYTFLVSGWGNSFLADEYTLSSVILGNIQPLFDAIRKSFHPSQ
jgi:hypothetical protein